MLLQFGHAKVVSLGHLDDDDGEEEEWEGRIRQITRYTDKIYANVRDQHLKMEFINEVFPNHIHKVDGLEHKVDRVESKIHDVESKITNEIKKVEMALL